jgi:haloacid dehalogenase superfamily, subfamily IA, variant 3 with third motif having DD or ED/haloacid dehalogenase superfamily, subfamily IA, variant 1 with third motif having Dx(3-4)D or Dx(3-4)E
MVKAVLFDCDGVLLDSESMYLDSLSKYLETLGRKAEIGELAYLVGTDIHRITEQLKADYHLEEYDTEELIQGQRAVFYRDFYQEGRLSPMEGLIDFLDRLQAEGIRMAVASSSPQEYVDYVLEQLRIEKYFEFAIGRETVNQAKPAPDLYQEAMKRLHILPCEAIVIEDSHNGVMAGLASGARVIAYKGSLVRQDTTGVHRTVYHYDEICVRDWKREPQFCE